MTPLAWIVLACCCLFLAVVAVIVFGKDRYDNSVKLTDRTDPAHLLYLAQLRDPGAPDYPSPHPNTADLMAIVDAVHEPQLGIGHLLAADHNPKTCPDCRELPR